MTMTCRKWKRAEENVNLLVVLDQKKKKKKKITRATDSMEGISVSFLSQKNIFPEFSTEIRVRSIKETAQK